MIREVGKLQAPRLLETNYTPIICWLSGFHAARLTLCLIIGCALGGKDL